MPKNKKDDDLFASELVPDVAPDPGPQPVSDPSETPVAGPNVADLVHLTVDKFIGPTNDPIRLAFVKTEKLAYGIRKMTRPDWMAEYQKFLSAPR